MGHQVHLTLREREDIMLMRRDGRGVSEIARAIGRSKSTVSRELKRNSCERFYRASTAQRRYEGRRLALELGRSPDSDTTIYRGIHAGRFDGCIGGRKTAKCIREKMPRALEGQPLGSVTLDRGKEFADHTQVTADIDVQFYFALPHHPWQRGTNENTNGLLREYFPKGESLARVSEKRVQEVYDKLNRRPRKRLGYRTPYEVHCPETLRLI